MLHIRTLMVFAISMIFFLPHSFAFSWQEDITNSVTTGNTIYGVYNGMPLDDFKEHGQMFQDGSLLVGNSIILQMMHKEQK